MLASMHLAGCGERLGSAEDAGSGSDSTSDVAGDHEGHDGAALACTGDRDCDDGVFCNGEERCDAEHPDADERGCRPALQETPCEGGNECDEEGRRCVGGCDNGGDADGDGHISTACGGDDCDDTDPRRSPSALEVCDADGHDEDCDPTTVGDRDADGDGFVSAACCNVTDETNCGEDCDDESQDTSPTALEQCDGADNDCDGEIDEGLDRVVFGDADRDGWGDAGTETSSGCALPDGYVAAAGDCDDSDPRRFPGADERCNALDDDCDGEIDEGATETCYLDADGDGWGEDALAVEACPCPDGYEARGGDCFDDPAAPDAPQVSPGRSAWRGEPYDGPSGLSFDYNCDGDEELRWVGLFVGCVLVGGRCEGTAWQADLAPDCGRRQAGCRCLLSYGSCIAECGHMQQQCR